MLEDLIKERLKKIDNFKQAGYDCYPEETNRTHFVADLLENFEKFSTEK